MVSLLFLPMVLAALGQASTAGPRLTAELTWGMLGPRRAHASYPPRDWVAAKVSITGLTPDKLGQVNFQLRVELRRPDGTVETVQRLDTGTQTLWRGNRAVHYLQLPLELNQAPGPYALRFHLYDRHGGQTADIELPFTVEPARFALLGPLFFQDHGATSPCGPSGLVGQRLFIKLGVVGHRLAGVKSKATCRLAVLNAEGHEVYTLVSPVLEVASTVLSFDITLPLLQAGNYTLRLAVVDEAAGGKREQVEIPMKVLEP